MSLKNLTAIILFIITLEFLLFVLLWKVSGGDTIFILCIWLFNIIWFLKTIIQKKGFFKNLVPILIAFVFGYTLLFIGNNILDYQFNKEKEAVSISK